MDISRFFTVVNVSLDWHGPTVNMYIWVYHFHWVFMYVHICIALFVLCLHAKTVFVI